jgi:hypothetical protein
MQPPAPVGQHHTAPGQMKNPATLWVATPAGDGTANAWAPWMPFMHYGLVSDAHRCARSRRRCYHGHLFAVTTDGRRPLPPAGSADEARRIAITCTLQAIDRNGCWLDDLAIADGAEPCTLAAAEAALAQMEADNA